MIEVALPDGRIIEFPDGTPPETMKAVAAKAAGPAKPRTNLAEQVGTGISEGVAGMLGLPVDAVTGMFNRRVEGVRQNAREHGKPEPSLGPIDYPLGGSANVKDALSPFMSDEAPQTRPQRIGRRVGHDVGAGAVVAPVAGVASLGGLALNTAADAASGLAGGVTAEITDDPTINAIASLTAGLGTVGGAYALRGGPQAPTNNALRAREDALWQEVRDSNLRLSPRGSQTLKGNVSARAHEMRMKPSLHGPEATAAVDEVWSLGDRPTLYEIEEARRFIGENTPAGFDKASTARITTGLRREVDEFLDRIPHPDAQLARTARGVSRQRIASEKLDRTLDRAERQAARSHNGANVVNSQRQRLDAILNNPKERASYTADELAQMVAIVRGTRTTNTARWLGSISPSRGGAYAGGNLGVVGATAGISGGDPVMTALAATPGVISYIARQVGERLTDAQIQRLSATIRNGGVPLAGKTLSRNEQAVLSALLATQAADQTQDQESAPPR